MKTTSAFCRWSDGMALNCITLLLFCGPRSSVGIANGYGLDGPGIQSRWGARFSAPAQTGPGTNPVSCTMGTRSFLGVKSGRVVTLTPHPLAVSWSRKSRAITLIPYGPYGLTRASVPVQGCTLPFFYSYFNWTPISENFLQFQLPDNIRIR